MSRAQVDKLVDRAKQLGAAGLVWMRVLEHGALDSPVAKFLSESEQLGLCDALGGDAGDLLLVVAGAPRARRPRARHAPGGDRPAAGARGRTALPLGRRLPAVRGSRRRRQPDSGAPPVHDAAPRRHGDPRARLGRGPARSALTGLRPRAERLGAGLGQRADPPPRHPGSGSSRCSASPRSEAQSRFGFLLDAFRYGAPPHAGFAFGIDRLVAVLAGEDNIREVIAFPKTQSGADPLTGAPSPLEPAQLAELGLNVTPRPKP